MRWLALLPLALFAALGGFFLSGLLREDPDVLPSVLIGAPAPLQTYGTLPGRTPLTADVMADGEVKLVNFWASWCLPCRVEHPQLEALSETVPVYGINVRDAAAAANGFLDEMGDPFAAIGTADRQPQDWGVYGLPETFVVAGDGTIAYRWVGPITESVVDATLLPQIAAARGD